MKIQWNKARPFVSVVVCLVLVFVACALPAAAAGELDTVRIGYFRADKYGYVGADGDLRGYDVQISKTVGMYGGFTAEMKGYDTVTEMEKALRSGEVDVLIDFLRTQQREQEFLFTETPIMEEKVSLFTRGTHDAPAVDSIAQIGSMRIGCVPDSGFLDYFLDYCSQWDVTPRLVEFDDEAEMRTALDRGDTDACLTGSVVPAGYRMLVSTVSLNSYMMLRSEDGNLRSRIDLALRQLNTDHPHYLSNLYQHYVVSHETELSPLTTSERIYLAEHPELTVAVVRGAKPFVMERDDGSLGGIIPEYYRELGKKLGVTFRFVAYDKNQEAVEAVSGGEADILGHYYGDIIIADREGLYDTIEYGSTDCARLTRSGFTGQAKTVAVTYRTQFLLADQLGEGVKLESYPNVEACYQAVMDGKVDAMVGSMTAVTWLVNQHTLRGVSLSVLPGVALGVRGAVAQKNRVLLFALNKAIAVSAGALDQAVIENAVSGTTGLRAALENLPLGFSLTVVGVLATLVILLILTLVRLVRSNRERMEILNREIEIDGLTGANSRRYGTQIMNRDLIIFRRYGGGPMLVMLDVDYFKGKNDTYGHEYGDYVLKKIVELLRETLRKSDSVIRWGGDEFVLVCPQVKDIGVEPLLSKVVRAVNSADFTVNGVGDRITISVGASFFRREDESIDAVLRRCDRALYQAKAVRNTYRIYDDGQPPAETAGKGPANRGTGHTA